MKKSKMYTGSICLNTLIDELKKGHSAFSKSKNGKTYVNVLLWENEEKDQYGNTHSLQLNSVKEKKDQEGKVYFGNCKPIEVKQVGSDIIDSIDSINF
jgi:folate-dependent tRNA-U54 methylase TrmFO/GidA